MTFFSLNIGNFITLRLTPTNYPLWREQALALTESQDLDSYVEDLQEREYTLRQQIIYLRKEDDQSIGEHIRTFKGLCDNLAAIGKPVPDKEKVFHLLTSLGHKYETFATTMLKPPRPSYSELIS
uniref:Retrotransposon gag domain-containing protein n=1 Tax=Glycine max TaxID=3847 RepID=A0A0R0HSL5_SOYBN